MRKVLLIPVWLLLFGAGSPPRGEAVGIDMQYQRIRGRYAALRADPVRRADIENWVDITVQLSALIGDESAERPRLDARMRYTLGMVYFGMYGQFRRVEDLQKAHDALNELVLKYPASPLADDAMFFRGEILHKLGDDHASARVLRAVIVNYPDGNRVADARQLLETVNHHLLARRTVTDSSAQGTSLADTSTGDGTREVWRRPPPPGSVALGEVTPPRGSGGSPQPVSPSPPPLVRLSGVKIWTNPDYTRLVIAVTSRVQYTHRLEPEGSDGRERLLIDLSGVRLDEAFEDTLIPGEDGLLVPVSGGLLRTVSVRCTGATSLRFTLDTGPLRTYRITPFQSPSRILIDLFGKVQAPEEQDDLGELVLNLDGQHTGAGRSDGKGFVVVLDAGHGGKDTGAIGPGGTREKDVVLAIARRTRDKLEAIPGITVVMVRERDVFVPLPERTAIANRHGADLFISIHANALSNPNASGVETYYLDTASDEGAARLAAKENATLKDHSLLDMIVQDLIISGNVRYSARLARNVQSALVAEFRRHYSPNTVRDLGVKSALFYVLFGAQMPSILVEVSFISHPVEEIRLGSARYQAYAADAICDGIMQYRHDTARLSRAKGM